MSNPIYLQREKKEGSTLFSLFLGIMLFFAVIGAYIAYEAATFLSFPPEKENPVDVSIDIRPGSTFDRIATRLHADGVITSTEKFRILAQYRGKLGSVQAGKFVVNTGWLPERVLQQITTGRQSLDRLALREGLTWWQTADVIEDSGFANAKEFAAVIHDPVFLYQYGIPFATAEGFLYPETYFIRKPGTLGGREQAEVLARTLVETFWQRAWPLLVQYAKDNPAPRQDYVILPGFELRNGLPVRVARTTPPPPPAPPAQAAAPQGGETQTPQAEPPTQAQASRENIPMLQAPFTTQDLRHVITMGSLVEKETGVPLERGRVAGVYTNRLRRGMLLQCDPTIIYGLGSKHSGPIRRSHLNDAQNIYNTYHHAGLPPGPICSSGEAALRAAVEPEKHDYIFFVATGKPDGTHTFTTNVRDHERAVRVFRATQGR